MDFLLSILKHFPQPDLRPKDVREFHDAVYKAIADGKITEAEIAQLEEARERLGLSEDVVRMIRHDLYVSAFRAVGEDEEVTEDEWDQMEHIQDFLGLNDVKIASTKKELYRLRILSEIKKGDLPVVQADGVILQEGELVHWHEKVAIFEHADGKEGKTLTLTKGVSLTQGPITDHAKRRWQSADAGTLYLTNKRIIIRGSGESSAIKFGSIIDVECFVEGVLLHVNRRKRMLLQYATSGNHSVVASILFALLADRS